MDETGRREKASIDLTRDDWRDAFDAATAGRPDPVPGTPASPGRIRLSDVVEVIAASDGERGDRDWIAVLLLRDGRYVFMAAGCSVTGWEAQSGGFCNVAASREELIRLGMEEEARERLGLS